MSSGKSTVAVAPLAKVFLRFFAETIQTTKMCRAVAPRDVVHVSSTRKARRTTGTAIKRATTVLNLTNDLSEHGAHCSKHRNSVPPPEQPPGRAVAGGPHQTWSVRARGRTKEIGSVVQQKHLVPVSMDPPENLDSAWKRACDRVCQSMQNVRKIGTCTGELAHQRFLLARRPPGRQAHQAAAQNPKQVLWSCLPDVCGGVVAGHSGIGQGLDAGKVPIFLAVDRTGASAELPGPDRWF